MMRDPDPVVRTLIDSPYRTVEEFFSKNGTKAQQFSINPTRRTTIVGSKGTRFTFLPFSICDVFGNPVKEEVTIKLIEISSRAEMVRSNKITVSEDRLLETAGQFLLQASRDFLPLDLCQPVLVELPVPESLRNPVAMRLYQGSTSSTRSFRSEKAPDWKLMDRKPVKVKKIRQRKYFTFQLDTFNWFSCNYLITRRAGRTMVSANMLSPVGELDDQAAFLAFKKLNTVASMYFTGTKFTVFNVPVNQPVQFLIIGLKEGQLYFGRTNMEKTSSQLVPVPLQPVSEQTLLKAINEL